MSAKVTVYRFVRKIKGHEVSPGRMMGTLAAIEGLGDSKPLLDSARTVDAKLLESGFFFEQTASAIIAIDTIPLRLSPN